MKEIRYQAILSKALRRVDHTNRTVGHFSLVEPLRSTFCLPFSYYYSEGQGLLPEVHQMEQQGEGDLQAGGQQGGVPPLGPAQEQAGHELRDHGSRSQVYFFPTFYL